MPKALGNWLLALASTVLSLAVVEVGLRLFKPDLALEPVTSHIVQFFRYDPELGWSHVPGVRGVHYQKEFSHPVSINSFGLRGPEISLKKPAGTKRIAVLGDSFTWGFGVTHEDEFTTLLQDKIPGSEVLNFGVHGYGPVQYYLLRKKVLEFEPDAVVIGFCLGNDFADSVYWRRYKLYKPFARLDENGKLVIDGYPIPNRERLGISYDEAVISWVYQHSYLYRFLDRYLLRGARWFDEVGQKGPTDFASDQSDFFLHPEKASVATVLNINRELLKGLAESFQERHIPVIVLAVPTKCDVTECFPGRNMDAERRALEQVLSGLPVTYVDPAPAIEIGDFWAIDPHWRPSAHRKVAAALLPAVERALEQK